MYYELTDRFTVSADLAATWTFFTRAENLPAITPSWLRFRIVTPAPVRIEQDARLDYTIRWMGLPVKWRTKIIDWTPSRQFIDLQVRGPYALWHHQHRFEQTAQGVSCTDRVIYQLPGAVVGRAVHAAVVRKQLLRIFQYRRQVISERLGLREVLQDVRINRL